MKILQVNVAYRNGSTGRIVYDIHSILKKSEHNARVCYGRGIRYSEPDVYKLAPEFLMKIQSLYSKITGYGYKGCHWSTKKLMKIIQLESPDVVHLHCINANSVDVYRILNYLKNNKIQTVLTLHAEFMFTGGCSYALECNQWQNHCRKCPQFKSKESNKPVSYFFDQTKKEWEMLNDAYSGFDTLTIACVSEWLKKRAMQSPMLKNKIIEIVFNGLDTEVFCPSDFTNLKSIHHLKSECIILHVTPDFYSPIKGGRYVIEIAQMYKQQYPDVKFIIVGYNGDGHNLPPNVIPVPHTKNTKELAQYYSLADITLLTSEKETFSMICAESLSCGTPVVGFEAGGPESISLTEYSHFVPYGDIDALSSALSTWIYFKKDNDMEQIAQEAHSMYSKEKMVNQYIDIYNKQINKI